MLFNVATQSRAYDHLAVDVHIVLFLVYCSWYSFHSHAGVCC